MKKFALLTAVATLGLMGLGISQVQAATTTNGLVSTFAIVGWFSPTTNDPVLTTNGSVITGTYTAKPVKITTKDVLNLLHSEFGGPAFPSGAQLAYSISEFGFVVLDKSGNIILDVSSNATDSSYVFSSETVTNTTSFQVISGKSIQSTTTTNIIVTGYVSDQIITYADANGNDFHFSGVETVKANENPSVYKTAILEISGSGGGSFFNPATGHYDDAVFTKASWKATGKNLPSNP